MGNKPSVVKLGTHLRKMRDSEPYCQDDEAKAVAVKEIFDLLDANQNGTIEKEECDTMWASFKKAFKGAAEKEPDLIKDLRVLDDFDFKKMEDLDTNQDGAYDLVEFGEVIEYLFHRLSANTQ